MGRIRRFIRDKVRHTSEDGQVLHAGRWMSGLTAEQIARRTRKNVHEVRENLAKMERAGWVRRAPDGTWHMVIKT